MLEENRRKIEEAQRKAAMEQKREEEEQQGLRRMEKPLMRMDISIHQKPYYYH